MVSRPVVWYGRVWYGMVGYGMVGYGMVGYGMVQLMLCNAAGYSMTLSKEKTTNLFTLYTLNETIKVQLGILSQRDTSIIQDKIF